MCGEKPASFVRLPYIVAPHQITLIRRDIKNIYNLQNNQSH